MLPNSSGGMLVLDTFIEGIWMSIETVLFRPNETVEGRRFDGIDVVADEEEFDPSDVPEGNRCKSVFWFIAMASHLFNTSLWMIPRLSTVADTGCNKYISKLVKSENARDC